MPSPQPARSERPPERRLELRGAAALAAAGLGLTLAAFAFGTTPLLVPGVGSLLLAVAMPAWLVVAVRAARLERHLPTRRVVEDEPLEAGIRIRRGLLGLPGGEVRDPLASVPVRLEGSELSVLAGDRMLELRVVARLHRRGRHRLAPPELTLSDPLGLVSVRRRGGGAGADVLVLPRVEPLVWRRPEHRRAITGDSRESAHEPLGAGEVDGLRQYMPGTPASRIHWPALARGAGLMERRLVSEPQARPLVVLDPRIDRGPGGEDRLDAAVRAAASLVLALARAGGCGILLPGDHVPVAVGRDLSAWPSVHTRLALVESERDPRRAPRLRRERSQGALIYVAASPPAGGLRRPAAGRSGRVMLVLPREVGGRSDSAPSFEIAGCRGYLLSGRGPEARWAA